MKKILISSLILSLIWIQAMHAHSSINTKKLILKKKQIETTMVPGKSYIKRLDKALSKYSDNKVVIGKILNRIAIIKEKLPNNEKSEQRKLLLEYIEYKSYTFFPELNIHTDEDQKDSEMIKQKEIDKVAKELEIQKALEQQRKIAAKEAYIKLLNRQNLNLSIDAKNAKTTDRISKMATVLENALINGRNLEDLITIDINAADKYGTNFVHSASGSYMVGTPNYSELGITKEYFSDGYDNELTIGTISSKSKYEVMGIIKGSEKQARIMGNFSPRNYTLIEGVDYKIGEGNSIILLKTSNIYKIRRGDIIDGKYSVTRVSRDGMTITFDKDLGNIKEININTPKGLIFNPDTDKPYQDGDIINE